MPAATSKADLLAVTSREWAKLETLMASVPPDIAELPDADGWSIRDVLVHRAHWIDLFLGWQTAAEAGAQVHMPAKGYKWSELKPYNAEVRERAQVMAATAAARHRSEASSWCPQRQPERSGDHNLRRHPD